MPPKMKDNQWYKLEVQVTDGQGLPPGEVKAFLKELANALACAENEMRVETDMPDDYEPPGAAGVAHAADEEPLPGAPLPEPAPPPAAPAPAPGGGVQPMYFCHNKGL